MTFFFLNQDETIIGTLNESEICRVDECNFTAEFSFMESSDFSMDDAVYVGFEDIDGNLVFYEIGVIMRDSDKPGLVSFDAEHAAMSELLQQVVEGKAVTGAMAGFAAMRVLEGSRWTVISSENTPLMSTTFYFRNRWDCLETIARMTGAAFYFAWTISGNTVTGRNVIVKARAGSSRGKRFDLSKDLANIHVDVDRTQLYTRLYGRGKGEEVGTDSEGDATYGRRIDFGEVVWSTDQGDPIDKPANQLYLEDPAATAMFGRGPSGAKLPREGIVIFQDCEDPEELIELTWEKYQTVRYPILTITAKVYDLERIWGYTHEAIRRGDDVLVIADEWNATYSDRIVGLIRDYNAPENTEVTIGDEGKSIVSLTASLTSTIAKVKEQAELGANMAAANPSMLQGIIDTMATIIKSTGTNMTTDPEDGSLVFTASDGNSAVKITGNGILISNQRIADAWVWKTAINGNGIATGELTAGTINATLIKILGSEQFYWDASNIFIINPSDTDQEIRIGKYDGTHYGIAFTTDGGLTWQNAIGFDGVHFSVSQVIDSEEFSEALSDNNETVFNYVNEGQKEISKAQDDIQEVSGKNDSLRDELDSFSRTVRNILKMDANGTAMIFQEITNSIESLEEIEGTHHNEILKYIRFENGDIILGEEGNPTILRLENDILGFWQNGKRVAYFNSGLLYVDNLEALTSLKLGSYSFYPNGAGGMSLKYIGT